MQEYHARLGWWDNRRPASPVRRCVVPDERCVDMRWTYDRPICSPRYHGFEFVVLPVKCTTGLGVRSLDFERDA